MTDADTTQNALKTIFGSKYGTAFSKTKKTYIKPLKQPFIEVKKDTVINNLRLMTLFVSPQRNVNRYEVFTKEQYPFSTLRVNGKALGVNDLYNGNSNRLLNYYVAKDKFLELEFSVATTENIVFEFYEISYDLLDNDLFDVKPRPVDMIPKPFVVNDAIIIKKSWDSKSSIVSEASN